MTSGKEKIKGHVFDVAEVFSFPIVENVPVDRGYNGDPFANGVKKLLHCEVEVAKRNELHIFKVIPKRWVVGRSFSWLERCRGLWENRERKLNTSLHMVILAFFVLFVKRF